MAVPLPAHIEVETSRLCNRRCDWCPNGTFTTRRVQELLDWGVLTRLAAELGRLRYAGWLATHNYNEPLLNPRLDDELALFRALVPDARPAIYTNGDHLDAERFDQLVAAGVRYLRVTRYPTGRDRSARWQAIDRWLARAGIGARLNLDRRPVRQGLAAVHDDGRLRVEVISPAIDETYSNRGGLVALAARPREQPCFMTATSAAIDYLGRLKMCCNVFADGPSHARYVAGDLHTSTFTELWESAAMERWRGAQATGDWSASPMCRGCRQELPESRTQPPAAFAVDAPRRRGEPVMAAP